MARPHVTFRPATSLEQALEQAARVFGIELAYWDVWGKLHRASPEVVQAILEALGVSARTLEEVNGALEQHLWEQWTSLTSPVVVLDEAGPWRVRVRLPEGLATGVLEVRLVEEAGHVRELVVEAAGLQTTATAELRQQRFVEKEMELPPLSLGYHRLELRARQQQGGLGQAVSQLIVAPQRAYLPPELREGGKLAGLTVALYGLRSARNWGVGDFTDLERLVQWAARRAGCSFLGLNPLHAIFNRRPFNTSPYLPASVYYRNYIYLDVERIEDFRRSGWALRLWRSPRVQQELEQLRASSLVDYERVARLKRVFLKLCFRSFLRDRSQASGYAQEFERFVEDEGELLHNFAVFCALEEWMHRRDRSVWIWPQWPARYQDPHSPAVEEFARSRWRSVLFWKYVQWQLDRQLARVQQVAQREGMTLGLFHDLALATDRCGADFWAYRPFFVQGCRVGAPPDPFSPKGQDWSFPPPAIEAHRQAGYRLLRDSIRRHCRHGGMLRIDHVMRFFRLFWIPEGFQASQGTYVRQPEEDLVRLVALESVRNKVVIVGEDLGTVEPRVREVLRQFGILGYRVFYFERVNGELKPPGEYTPEAVVSSSTHDLPTLAGFWLGRDIEARREAGLFPDEEAYHRAWQERQNDKQLILAALHREGLLPPWVPRDASQLPELTGELHNAIIGYLARTPCLLFSLNQEDLTKETEQQNLPGTTAEYPNWSRKMRFTLEELESSPEVEDFLRMLRRWLAETGRMPQAAGKVTPG